MAMIFEDIVNQTRVDGSDVTCWIADLYHIEMGTELSELAAEWLDKHGIDIGWVAADSLVTRNEFDHTITYCRALFGIDPAGDGDDVMVVGSMRVVEQGEAGPWPYPEQFVKQFEARFGDSSGAV